jgi:phospholipid transport system transporter-binding protein
MSGARIEQQDPGHYRVSGELNMYTVPDVLSAIRFDEVVGKELHIDLGEVSRSDSAGLALLVEWMRQAREQGIQLHFHHLPAQLLEIARVSDLLPLLPLD